MRSKRPIQLAALLIAAAVTSVSVSRSAPTGKSDAVYPVVYSIADLPVYRLGPDAPAFDPSVIIALIKESVAPASWTHGNASIGQFVGNASLVIWQTQENHERTADLLDSLRKEPRSPDSQSPESSSR
jgi:hypothetical protein